MESESSNLVPKSGVARYDQFLVPCLWFAVVGGVLGVYTPNHPLWTWLGLGMILLPLAGLVLWRPWRRVFKGAAWILVLMLGGIYTSHLAFQPSPTDALYQVKPGRVQVEAIVSQRKPGGRKGTLTLRQINGRDVTGQSAVSSWSVRLPDIGSRVLLYGELDVPHRASVPGGFDYRQYLWHQGVTTVIHDVSRLDVLDAEPATGWHGVFRMLDRLSSRIAGLFQSALPGEPGRLLGSIVLGDKAAPVSKPVRESFIQTGLVHLLAASGMNVAIIGSAILALGRWLGLSRHVYFPIALLAVAIYAGLTGLPPSIQRAGLMFEMALLLKWFDRELSPVFLLSIVTVLMMILQPDILASLGFQLSVLTTFGILTMVPPAQKALERYCPPWLTGVVVVPLIAQLWATPLTLSTFNQLPWHVVLMNILVLPFILVLTPLGFTAGAVGLVWQPAGEAIAWAAGGLLKLMLMLVAWGNSLPGMLAELPSPDSLHITLMYGVLIGLVLLMTQPWVFRPRIKCVMAVFLVFLVSVYPVCRQWQGHSQLVVDWMSLSTNQAVVLIQPPGRAQPIAFVTPLARRNQRNLADFFRRQGIQGLSGLIHLTPVGSDPEEATRLSTPQQTSTARHYWLTASPKRPDELAYPVAAQYGPVTLDCDSPQHFRSSQNSLPACILDLAGRRWRLSEQLASMRWVIQGSRLWVYAHHAGE